MTMSSRMIAGYIGLWGAAATPIIISNMKTSRRSNDEYLERVSISVYKGLLMGYPIIFVPLITCKAIQATYYQDKNYLLTPFIYKSSENPEFKKYCLLN